MSDGTSPSPDLRATHVPKTIAGRPAVKVREDEGMTVYAPLREDGKSASPFPHVTVREKTAHVSDLEDRDGATSALPKRMSLKYKSFDGGKAPSTGKVDLGAGPDGTALAFKGDPISPRTYDPVERAKKKESLSARFDVSGPGFDAPIVPPAPKKVGGSSVTDAGLTPMPSPPAKTGTGGE